MSLIAELKRRNVFRVGVAYAMVGWLLGGRFRQRAWRIVLAFRHSQSGFASRTIWNGWLLRNHSLGPTGTLRTRLSMKHQP